MAKYSLSWTSLTMTATADAATELADNTFAAIQGGNATQRNLVSEIYIGGEAASTSSPTLAVFARHSTVSTGGLTSETPHRLVKRQSRPSRAEPWAQVRATSYLKPFNG